MDTNRKWIGLVHEITMVLADLRVIRVFDRVDQARMDAAIRRLESLL